VVEKLDGEGFGPTFFEIITAAAFEFFARRGVDLAVMEVGLGGRLDSTNVCLPRVCVITNISRDHMRQLGRSLASIAGEKAGIVKPGVPVVSGVTHREAREVVQWRAAECQAELVEIEQQFGYTFRGLDGVRSSRFDFWRRGGAGGPIVWGDMRVNLLGEHQAFNASVALAALLQLGTPWEVSESAARAGLESVACPARIEVVRYHPLVVLDTAHNAASARALRTVIESGLRPAGRRWLVLTATQGKDVRGILRELLPCFHSVLLTRYRDNPRGLPPETLYGQALHVMGEVPAAHRPTVRWYAEPDQAWRALAPQLAPDDLVCITGSFFFAAEARRLIGTTAVCPRAMDARPA
jgi:dihydrofolate synthase/folylpolyglutamate synthase